MMNFSLTVKLPPEDTILRDLALTSLIYVRERGFVHGVNIEWAWDTLSISAPSSASIIDVFKSLFEDAADVANQKTKRMRLGILRNDQQILTKLMGEKPQGLTYLDAIERFLRAYVLSDIDLSSLSQVQVGNRGITLGKGGFAALNFLTSERYEYGLEFWKLNYRLRFQIELDRIWYALILAGFALTASAFINNEVLLIYLPEDFIHNVYTNSKIFEVMKSDFEGLRGLHKKVSNTIYERGCVSEPFPSFVLFLCLNLLKEAKILGTLSMLNSLPLALCRIRRVGNVFTMVEKRRAELFDVMKFVVRLAMAKKGLEAINELRDKSERALRLGSMIMPREGEADFTVYNRFFTMLLQAIQGAYSPYEAVYYGARHQLISMDLSRAIIHAFSK